MVLYRRNFTLGGTYFFTVTLRNRKSTLLIDQIDLLKTAFNTVKKTHPFITLAYVILPDHLHVIWKLPPDDMNYSHRWRLIKTFFSKGIKKARYRLHQSRHNEIYLWQRRFWEHTITDERDLENHINYIHFNPVKHKLIHQPSDWPFSSFHHFVKNGKLPENWMKNIPHTHMMDLYND